MQDILEKEIIGAPAMVTIRGRELPLTYRMHNVILYKQQTGDSLFDRKAWSKIDLATDPERWLACLWAGLHERQADKSWKSPYTLDDLGALIDFSNAADISVAMVKALTQYMPKAKEGENDPKAEGLEETLGPSQPPRSASSGDAPATATASPAANS